MKLENFGDVGRVWPSLRTADGHTLELEPGEVADVMVDECPAGAFLRPAGPVRKGRGVRTEASAVVVSGLDGKGEGISDMPDIEPADLTAGGKED